MWFKNVKAYQITQPLSLDEGDLERALNEHAFRPCGSQDLRFVKPCDIWSKATLAAFGPEQVYL